MLIVREGGGGQLISRFAVHGRRRLVVVLVWRWWWVGMVLRVVARVGGGVGVGAAKGTKVSE